MELLKQIDKTINILDAQLSTTRIATPEAITCATKKTIKKYINIAIIPARGGSKRIPLKNIKLFNNKPMIAYTIEAAKSSNLFDKNNIIVSTDSDKIAQIARKYGANVPFMRPKHLCDDYITLIPIMRYIINKQLNIDHNKDNNNNNNNNSTIHNICLLYATAPFIESNDIIKGYNLLNDLNNKNIDNSNKHFTFSATDYEFAIFRSFYQCGNGVKMFWPKYYNTRSQDLPHALHGAAQFVWGTIDAWNNNDQIYNQYAMPVMIPRWRVQDIDTIDDWNNAEILAIAIKLRKERDIEKEKEKAKEKKSKILMQQEN